MRNPEVAEVVQSVLSQFPPEFKNEKTKIAKIVAKLEEDNNKLVVAIKRDKELSVLAPMDGDRDAKYKAAYYLNQGYTYHPNDEIREAALAFELITEKYGLELADASYNAETVLLQSFLMDTKKPEVRANIVLLPGMVELLTLLETSANDFVDTRKEYKDSISEVEQHRNATQIKRELLSLFNNKLLTFLRAMEATEEEAYLTICSNTSMYIKEANTIVKQRRTKK